ncbi:MAG: alanine racemase [Clostridia bacterium]|jgi:alanine racemase|nr:alanine racemase [Clostridia bacterium]
MNEFPAEKWVEIDLAAIAHNFYQVRQLLDATTRILAVVKADAYGHGASETARTLEALGADMLGVTSVAEGKSLRENGITIPILVFGPFLPEEAALIVEYDLTPSIAAHNQIGWLRQALSERNRTIKVHLKIETGMGRTGLLPEEAAAAALEILSVPGMIPEGVYSHFAAAMGPDKTYTYKQYERFQTALQALEQAGVSGLIRHIANSAAIIDLPGMQLDMVRTGTLLYGQFPSPRQEKSLSLQNTWQFRSRIIYLHDLPAGHSIGYGRTYKTTRPSRIAVIPVGFTDGLQMEPLFKPAGFVDLAKGIAKQILYYLNHPLVTPAVTIPAEGRSRTARIVGKIGMQLTMVDVTGIPGIEIGTLVQAPIRRTAVSPAVPRLYLRGNSPRTGDGISRADNPE